MSPDSGFYRDLLDNLYDGVYFLDLDRRITYWNRGAERITGYTGTEVVGTHCHDNILVHLDRDGKNLCVGAMCPASSVMLRGAPCEETLFLRHKEGHRVPVVTRVSPIRDASGKTVGAAEVFTDNSHEMASLREISDLRSQVFLDPLTKLASRQCVDTALFAKLNELERYGWGFGVAYADIDHLEQVNQERGRDVGDKLIKMVATTMLNCVRPFDVLGRWAGEEFIGIIVNVESTQLEASAHRFRRFVEASGLPLEDGVVSATISVGATLAKPGDTAEAILARLKQLLERAKAGGGNRVAIDVDA